MQTTTSKHSLYSYSTQSNWLLTPQSRALIVVIVISLAQGLIISCATIWNYVYKDDFHLSPASASSFSALLTIPWMIKPLWGFISDTFPIFGYKRKSYLIIMTILAWMSIFSFSLWIPPIALGFIILAILNMSQSFQSVVAQAIIVENAQDLGRRGATEEEKSEAAAKGVSFFFGAKLAGQVIFSILMMLLLTEEGRQQFLFGASFIPLCVFLTVFLLPELKIRKNTQTDCSPFLQSNSNVSLNEVEQGHNIENQDNNPSNFRKTLAFIKTPLVYRSMLLLFMNSFTPNAGQAKFYYFTNFLNFTPSFIGTLSLVACVATIVGIIIYNKFYRNTKLRKIYTVTVFICVGLILSQLILIYRWNVQLGISDQVFAAIDTFVTDMGGEINALPIMIMACRICPKNIEATVFALFLACNNAGIILAQQLGALIINRLGITADNFDKLDIMVMISAAFQLLPLLVLWTFDYEKAIRETEEINSNLSSGNAETTTVASTVEQEKRLFIEGEMRRDSDLAVL